MRSAHSRNIARPRRADGPASKGPMTTHSTTGTTTGSRFERAIQAIDAANAEDPTRIDTPDGPRPKELVHAELLTGWVRRLRPDASEALLLAARAHHIRRWTLPRTSYPPGRSGYLRWRTRLHDVHAEAAAAILASAGYDEPSIARVQTIIRKEHLREDPEVQTLEDALCLVFLDLQLDELTASIADEAKMVSVLRKSWAKMSPAGREFALGLDLTPAGLALVRRALDAS
jgi:Domain of unknown function (DUF4202)